MMPFYGCGRELPSVNDVNADIPEWRVLGGALSTYREDHTRYTPLPGPRTAVQLRDLGKIVAACTEAQGLQEQTASGLFSKVVDCLMYFYDPGPRSDLSWSYTIRDERNNEVAKINRFNGWLHLEFTEEPRSRFLVSEIYDQWEQYLHHQKQLGIPREAWGIRKQLARQILQKN